MNAPVKKLLICCAVICILCTTLFGQPPAPAGSKNLFYTGSDWVDTTKATSAQWEHIRFIQRTRSLVFDEDYFLTASSGKILNVKFAGAELNKSNIYSGPQSQNDLYLIKILIDGNSPAEFASVAINEKNIADFRYRVVQNNVTILVPWKQPSVIKTTTRGMKYIYLGLFNYAPGHVLKIEVYNIKTLQHDAIQIEWPEMKPAQLSAAVGYIRKGISSSDNDNMLSYENLKALKVTKDWWITTENGKSIKHERPYTDFRATTNLSDIKILLGDSLQNIRFTLNSGRVNYNYKVSLKRDIDGKTDSLNLGVTAGDFELYKEFWKEPGKYTITFTPRLERFNLFHDYKILWGESSGISFTVLPPLNIKQTIPVKFFLLIITIILTTCAYIFVMYRNQQKRRLKKEAQNRQIATLQLQAVRSQLNPHFIFNALAGIQNLMNKNEVENANKYLARFARLTRNILDDGNKELTNIEHEISLLNDYLQMEQTRFGFRFDIQIDVNDIDPQTEIPAMLLQPFAENAVKHGVSALKNEGMITIRFTRQGNNLILSIQDNGGGFKPGKSDGMGMKLCAERITLLNSIYKNSLILLHQKSDSSGTLITIDLNNWL